MAEANWYVVHTYSGYENKVKTNIEQSIENRKLQDQILEVSVPTQEVVELKNGVKKVSEKKLFPGHMVCCKKYQRCYRIRRSGVKASSSYRR